MSALVEYWHRCVEGRGGWGGSVVRAGLWAAQWPYRLAVACRNWYYDQPHHCHRVPVPVISVGNLSVGGTGKTPMVLYLARTLRQMNRRVVIVSRGYKAPQGAVNDEALELERHLSDVPHLQHHDRVQAAQIAIDELQTQVILLDDGFQHRRLGRDLDIVLLDGLCPFGHGHLLPRGLLREPISSLQRAQVVVLTRCDLIHREQIQAVARVVHQLAPQALWIQAAHRPRQLFAANDTTAPLEHLKHQPVAAFCGIGNPEGFRRSLQHIGYELVGFWAFEDHHHYTTQDVERLAHWAQKLQAQALLCTGKDLVKLGVVQLGSVPLWALEVEMQILQGEQALRELIRQTLEQSKKTRE